MPVGRPRGAAPTTGDLLHTINVSNSDFEAWVSEITEDFPAWRVAHEAPNSDLWTARQLVDIYGDKRVTANGAARLLTKRGFMRVGNTQGRIITSSYGVLTVYAMHNSEYWVKAKHVEIRDHYMKYFPKR